MQAAIRRFCTAILGDTVIPGSLVTMAFTVIAGIFSAGWIVRAELRTDIKELRAEMTIDIKELRAEMKTDIKELRADFKELQVGAEKNKEDIKAQIDRVVAAINAAGDNKK